MTLKNATLGKKELLPKRQVRSMCHAVHPQSMVERWREENYFKNLHSDISKNDQNSLIGNRNCLSCLCLHFDLEFSLLF